MQTIPSKSEKATHRMGENIYKSCLIRDSQVEYIYKKNSYSSIRKRQEKNLEMGMNMNSYFSKDYIRYAITT